MSKIARLMVATDLTERSQRAFERAIELKNQPSATITLLRARGAATCRYSSSSKRFAVPISAY
jgi:nucleotide-binding universal stress UspA family protein